MIKDDFIGLKLTKEMKDKIKTAADKQYITMSSWIFILIQKELNK